MSKSTVAAVLHPDQIERLNKLLQASQEDNQSEALRKILDAGFMKLGYGRPANNRRSLSRGRPTTDPIKQTMVGLPSSWYEAIDKAAEAAGQPRSAYLRSIIGDSVKRAQKASKGRGKTDEEIYLEAVDLVRKTKRATTTTLRTLGIGTKRAKKILAMLTSRGVVEDRGGELRVLPAGVRVRRSTATVGA